MVRNRIAVGLLLCLSATAAWSGCATGVTTETDGEGGEGGEGGSGAGGMGGGAGSTGVGGQDAGPNPTNCESASDCSAFAGPCTVGSCVNGWCEATPANEFGSCDDGLFCTENDTCVAGACAGGTPRYCPSLDSCHLGTCDEDLKTCKNIAGNDGAQCDDGDACTGAGVCSGGVCSKGQQVNCSVFNGPCSVGVCDPAVGCVAMPVSEGSFCDNGDFTGCSYGQCQQGSCVSLPQNDGAFCDDGDFNECSVGFCQNAQCMSQPVNEGMLCEDFDGNQCTGMCSNGICAQIPVNNGSPCEDFDGNQCTGICSNGFCSQVPANNGQPCDDYLFCTSGESCTNGVCGGGQPTLCAPPGGCWIAACDENFDTCSAVPGNDGAVCDDFDVCTDGTTCSSGVCSGGMAVNDGVMCNDGASCTTGETCSAGICGGGVGPTIYFQEDFKDNGAGWTLGPEWQISTAKLSQGGVFGADPAVDHTSTVDNGVAGVVIGGNASTNLHAYYYLESPAFNTANAAGSVVFSFWRWLNSDYDPYMHNVVEVFNGQSWIQLWISGGPPGVNDNAWTYIQYDVTQWKNAAMRVRFGFDITSGGVYTIGSWNVDDVLVASQGCP